MRVAWLFICVFVTVLQVQLITRRLGREQLRMETRGGINRLVKVTLQLFQNGHPPKGEAFWKEIGRTEPMVDAWGKPYVLEAPRAGLFIWRSAGPDGGYGTDDDIFAHIPYGEGVNIDLSSPVLEPAGLPVDSAL
jgi:hypothetical protein